MTERKDRTQARPEAVETARRRFLAGAGALATVAIAPGVTLIASGSAAAKDAHEPTSPKIRWGMLIDINKCDADCSACVTACKEEQGWGVPEGREARPKTDPQWIRKVNVKNPETGRQFSLPVMCQHCETPPCADVCPTGASFKRMDGVVLVDRHLCIGCRYCMMACPYKARSFVHEVTKNQRPHLPRGKGCVEACTMCTHRIDRGDIPACAERCLTEGRGAILFGDLNDPNSEIAKKVASVATQQIRADLGLNPGVRYQGI